MKKILALTLLIITMVFHGCSNNEEPSATSTPQATEVVGETDSPTPEPTEAPTPEPTKEPLKEEQLGIPQEDAEVIYLDDYADGYISNDAIFRYKDGHEIVDDQLYLSIYNGNPVERAETYAANIYCEAKKDGISQYQFHLKFKTSHEKAENNPWMSSIIGVRVYEPLGNSFQPKDENSGIYIATTQFNKIIVYHGIPSHWPQGAFSLSIPEGFGEMSELTIVDTGDKIFYYQTLGNSDQKLFMTIDLSTDLLIAYDAEGNEVYSAENNLKDDKGGYFKIFNHFGRTVIDEFSIKVR